MNPSPQQQRQGIVLILVTIIMVILAVLTTAFLTRMRNTAGSADEVIRLAQNRISLFAALTFIQESSRIGYSRMEAGAPWLTAEHREGHGWIDVRVEVPDDSTASSSEGYQRFADIAVVTDDNGSISYVPGGVTLVEHDVSRRIGPRAADGRILWPYSIRRMQGIQRIEVTDPGSGYSAEPTVSIAPPPGIGRQARARAVVREGRLQRIEIIDPGWGYSSQPSVTVSGPASAEATGGAWVNPDDWNNYVYAAVATANPTWPAPGSIIRVPFYRQQRPPFAVDPTVVRNPIPTDHTQPTFGIPFFTNPDPLPLLPDGMSMDPTNPGPSTQPNWRSAWAAGDPMPAANSTNLGWFRIYRETGYERDRPSNAGPPGSTFIITVGSGGTLGFRDWADVESAGATATFDHSPDLFDMLAAGERRHSYRVEWIGGVGGGEEHLYALPLAAHRSVQPAIGEGGSWYEQLPINSSRFLDQYTTLGQTIPSVFQTSPPLPRNYIGTIRYIQRLEPHTMPANW
ncbi:MAG: hypothetical protein EA402_10325 [Planctomycetota bacterium]|nr:MAG: hypothetical protein EA402_10325 [Planctomycetota bacterium]